ncbi:Thioredoxin-like fold [Artemisia annua]|uniref:Thioredoxin-like fold n=1 Tax=Artemisia annua TaxID=35608 RepID=A0A2U1N7G3_ARTAN|nr:Thioredoxin-like fold [Artemisia annua]
MAISKNEDFFEKFRWVCHLDQKMSVMGMEYLFRLLIHQKDKVEATFMEVRSKFFNDVVFDDIVHHYIGSQKNIGPHGNNTFFIDLLAFPSTCYLHLQFRIEQITSQLCARGRKMGESSGLLSLPMLMGLRYKNAKCYQLFGPVEFRQIIRSLPEAFFFITSTDIDGGAIVFQQYDDESSFHLQTIAYRISLLYYTGYPKDLGPSRVIHFTSEREFVHLLHQGVITPNILTRFWRKLLHEFYPQIKFMRVECPKYIGFCMTRQKKDYPFIEMFRSPAQASAQGNAVDPNVTNIFILTIHSFPVLCFQYNYDVSAYGFREFFKRHNIGSFSRK